MTTNGNGDGKGTGSPISLLGRVARNVGVVPDRTTSRRTEHVRPRITGAQVTDSVCPYCAVGCSQVIHHRDGQVINIEGNYASPINQGTLCPKGAATYQLVDNPNRLHTVKYRAPHSDHWEDRPLDWAMERIAQLVKETRDATWEATDAEGHTINRTRAIAHLGGATLDNEENYLIKKLFTGLGMIWVENQARI
jgi:formate dehydrogenase major subunit